MCHWAVAAAASLSILLSPASALSETTPKDVPASAVSLYEESLALYRAGDLAGALGRLRDAYGMTHAAVLLYNMARSYEGLGDLRSAIDTYERYIAEQPDAQDRGAIEQRLTTLRRQLADQEALRRSRATVAESRVTPEVPAAGVPRAVPWTVAAAGVTALAVGAILGGLAEGDYREASRTSTPQSDAIRDNGTAQSLALDANILIVSGAAVAAAGIVWGIVNLRKGTTAARAAPMFTRVVLGFRSGGFVGLHVAAF